MEHGQIQKGFGGTPRLPERRCSGCDGAGCETSRRESAAIRSAPGGRPLALSKRGCRRDHRAGQSGCADHRTAGIGLHGGRPQVARLRIRRSRIRDPASAACTNRSSTTAATRARSSSPVATKNPRSAMAHGYAKIEGKPLLVFAHGTVGLQHASMAIYNAYCDRVPVYIVLGNIIDATKRDPSWNGRTACRMPPPWSATTPNGTTCRSRCSTSPSPPCAPTKSP